MCSSDLKLVAQPPVQRQFDPSLAPGTSVVQDAGEAAYSTSVHRLVYASSGKLLSNATWYSNYVALPEIVLVGPNKPKPKVKTKPAATTPTTPAQTTPTPSQTTPTGQAARALQ